jgi:hypothetical protein
MKLTPEMAQRYDDGRGTAFSAPCIICGGVFAKCGHWESGEAEEVCKRLKQLGKVNRDKLRKGQLS